MGPGRSRPAPGAEKKCRSLKPTREAAQSMPLARVFNNSLNREGGVMKRKFGTKTILIFAASVMGGAAAQAGPSGSEMDMGLMPASGGMEGVGIVRPQDNVAMVFGNPASLTQLKGQFGATFGGSYVSPNLKLNGIATIGPDFDTGGLLGGPVNGHSRLGDLAMPHAAVVQRYNEKLVMGMGITGVSGLGSDWRNVRNVGLIADLKLFGAGMSVGYQVNEKLSLGGTFVLGIGSFQVGTLNNTASVNNFGISGTLGFTYDMGMFQLGGTYKSKMKVTYDKVVQVDAVGTLSDFTLTQPTDITVGVASTDKFNSNMLIEVDFRWKNYSKANGYQDFWRNQWKIAGGISYKMGEKLTLRGGYSFARGIAKKLNGTEGNLGELTQLFFPGAPDVGLGPDVAPVFADVIQLAQATIANGLWKQGISTGMGYQVFPNLRADVNIQYSFDGKANLVSPIPGSPQNLNVNGTLLSFGMGFSWSF